MPCLLPFPAPYSPTRLPRPRTQASRLRNHYASKIFLGFPCCCWPACVPFRSEPPCCRGSWPLGQPQERVLASLPTPPQFNPSSFPQYTVKAQSVGRKSQNHDCLLPAPVLGKPLVPYPPAMASQGSHPMNTLCPGALCCWRGGGAGSRSAHRPSRATPRRFMLCHCRQRSVLRPYHSFLTLIVLPELKCCI